MKRLLSILLIVLFVCVSLCSCTIIEEPETPNDAPTSVSGLTYVSLRINPEVEMVVDEAGTVISANAVNTDGEVVLAETSLEGKTVEDAAEAFADTAVNLGYMDTKDTVYVGVEGENAEVKEKVEKSLSDKLAKYFDKKGITAKVSKEVLDTYLAAAEEHEITPGHAKIIARVLEANPELTYDKLLNLTVKELLDLLKVHKHEDTVAADLKVSYGDKVKALREEYAELFQLREIIEDIEDDLDDDDDDELTAEEKAKLETELAEAKAKIEPLEKEYKEKLDAIKAEFKESSKDARDEHKKQAEERKKAKEEGKSFIKPDDDDDDEREAQLSKDKNEKKPLKEHNQDDDNDEEEDDD